VDGFTLDAGGLIALDRRDRFVMLLLHGAEERGARVTIPATALAQSIRRPDVQARLSKLVRQQTTDVVALDQHDAVAVGRLLAFSGTADITDAHVVICARRRHQIVITSDPDDLGRLDPRLELVVV
jgi:predicted nucleic acid-binding protein